MLRSTENGSGWAPWMVGIICRLWKWKEKTMYTLMEMNRNRYTWFTELCNNAFNIVYLKCFSLIYFKYKFINYYACLRVT